MKIRVDEDRSILLTDVFLGVGFKTEDGEEFNICMRDGGYEFGYGGVWYAAKDGAIKPLMIERNKSVTDELPQTCGGSL